VECLRRMPVRKAGGSGDAGKKKRGRDSRGPGLGKRLSERNKQCRVADPTE
jgi:hypothetical protein